MNEKHALFCDGKTHTMERFLEACLLLLLYDEAGYGYGLIEQLAYFVFPAETLNVSTLYRTLRKMEKDELVTSAWQSGGQGPKRRVYLITENGKKSLDDWVEILSERRKRIDKLIHCYNEKTGVAKKKSRKSHTSDPARQTGKTAAQDLGASK